jgi:hypothetical protein
MQSRIGEIILECQHLNQLGVDLNECKGFQVVRGNQST